MTTEINKDNIGEIHYNLGEYYLLKSYKSYNDKYDCREVALMNFQMAKHHGDTRCNKAICDLMMDLGYYSRKDKLDIVFDNIQQYLIYCKVEYKEYDVKYILYCEFLEMLQCIYLDPSKMEKITEEDYGEIEAGLKETDERITEYELAKLFIAMCQKNIEDFTTCVVKIQDKLDTHMVAILLTVKNSLSK